MTTRRPPSAARRRRLARIVACSERLLAIVNGVWQNTSGAEEYHKNDRECVNYLVRLARKAGK